MPATLPITHTGTFQSVNIIKNPENKNFFSAFLKGPFPQVAEICQGKQPPDAGKSCGNNPERRGNASISLYYIFTREKAGRESVHAAHLAAERATRVHLPYACEAVRSVVVLRAPVVLAV